MEMKIKAENIEVENDLVSCADNNCNSSFTSYETRLLPDGIKTTNAEVEKENNNRESTESSILNEQTNETSSLQPKGVYRFKVEHFECKICKLDFLTETGLARHLAIHTGDNPLKWGMCPFRR
ncbi:hypothetical protein ILUMI_05514 [Ignelater luminosus]|uniref:C2H2-type domain-containing protein n=1 Tax=Ignelater luminosus TaxID=2038154 RepID=A0A8K0D751_IGNLU|nr:hypothetical protein ILUMI_05514 [Ignelater luminosus]